MKSGVVLIGMPGVGKSTVGVLLAKRLGIDFLDSDVFIQTRERRRLWEIIQQESLSGFCRIEERHVLSLSPFGCVIATGGSVVYSERAMKHLPAAASFTSTWPRTCCCSGSTTWTPGGWFGRRGKPWPICMGNEIRSTAGTRTSGSTAAP